MRPREAEGLTAHEPTGQGAEFKCGVGCGREAIKVRPPSHVRPDDSHRRTDVLGKQHLRFHAFTACQVLIYPVTP